MNTRLKFIALSLLCAAAMNTIPALAQREKAIPKEERIREMLQEKTQQYEMVDKNRDISPALKTTSSADQRVSIGSSYQEGEVSISINPNDSNKLVLSYMQQGGGLSFPMYYSSDGGTTWKKSLFNTNNILSNDFPGHSVLGGGDPTFTWNKHADTVYFSWIYLSGGVADTAYFTLNWAYSYDDGRTWNIKPSSKHFIGQGFLNISTGTEYGRGDGICDREWLAIDNSGGAHQGRVYCSFVNFIQGGECIKFKEPNADTFGTIHIAARGTTQFGNVEVDESGTLHVSYGSLDDNAIYHVSSTDGLHFSVPHKVYDGLNLFGQTGIVHSRENAAPNLAVDGAGNLHLVWSDFDGSSVFAFYANSTDKGVTWSTPKRIASMSASFAGKQAFMPTVAAYGNNVSISVTAIDSATDDSARYYQLISTDNGKTFGTPALLSLSATYYPEYIPSSPNYFFGDYNRSVRTACHTYALWEDGRNNLGPKVYFARTNQCSPANVTELTAVSSAIQVKAVYPNPASDKATIDIESDKAEQVTLTINDITGKTLVQQQANIHTGAQQISLNVANLSSGIYMLSVADASGLIATRKLQVIR
jgi:hypothetical protein